MDRFVNHIGAVLYKNRALKQDDLDVFAYGLDLILFTIATMLVLLTLGLLTGRVGATVCCAMTYMPLQVTGGGYHANTHLRCFLTTIFGWAVAMALNHFLPLWALILFMAQGVYAVFMYAPIEHVNAPMSTVKKLKMRRFARRICVSLSLLMTALFLKRPDTSLAIAVGMGMYGISAHTAYMLKKRDEQRHNSLFRNN